MMSLESANIFIIPRTQEEHTLFGIEIIKFIYRSREYGDYNNAVELIIGLTILHELDYDNERVYIFSIAATVS